MTASQRRDDVVRIGTAELPDAPVLVLVPELAVRARDLRRLAAAWVASGRRVHILDLYAASRPPFDYADVITRDIPELLVDAGDGAVLAGIGFGGQLALLAVAELPHPPVVVVIGSGLPGAEPQRPGLFASASSGAGVGAGGALGDLARVLGAREGRIASDGSGELARLGLVHAEVVAVGIGGDRTVPPASVDRLAAALPGPVHRVDVPLSTRGDSHLRWFRRDPEVVVAAVESALAR